MEPKPLSSSSCRSRRKQRTGTVAAPLTCIYVNSLNSHIGVCWSLPCRQLFTMVRHGEIESNRVLNQCTAPTRPHSRLCPHMQGSLTSACSGDCEALDASHQTGDHSRSRLLHHVATMDLVHDFAYSHGVGNLFVKPLSVASLSDSRSRWISAWRLESKPGIFMSPIRRDGSPRRCASRKSFHW